MLKSIPILIVLMFATSGVLSVGIGSRTQGGTQGGAMGIGGMGTNGNKSLSLFNPMGFSNFILSLIKLPFRIIGNVFGYVGAALGSGSNNMSMSPFNPIAFTNFILYTISKPFSYIARLFGFSGSMGNSSGMTNSNGGSQVSSNDSIFNGLFNLPRAIARFIEEIFHFERLLYGKIFGDLELGAAYYAGNGKKSSLYRKIRNRNATAERIGMMSS